jgi:hypothetical protein
MTAGSGGLMHRTAISSVGCGCVCTALSSGSLSEYADHWGEFSSL